MDKERILALPTVPAPSIYCRVQWYLPSSGSEIDFVPLGVGYLRWTTGGVDLKLYSFRREWLFIAAVTAMESFLLRAQLRDEIWHFLPGHCPAVGDLVFEARKTVEESAAVFQIYGILYRKFF